MRKDVVVVVATVSALAVAASLTLWQLRSTRQWRRANRLVKRFGKQCATPLSKLLQVADSMALEMQAGLTSDGASSLQMIVSDIDSLPTGAEEGLFYGLELRATSCVISRVKLGGKDSHVIKQEVREVPIPAILMVGSYKDLFNYIAAEVLKFVSTEDESFHVPSGRQKELGCTISFPVDQETESSQTVIKFAKYFPVKDTVGKDMVVEINEALEKNGVDLQVPYLVNDTVGTLASARYFSSNVVVGLILGMGTNASYVEDALAIPKCEGPLPLSGEMVINIEWGNFQSSHLPITEFDICLDVESLDPGKQVFDKLVSGMYLGEILRRVLLRIAEETSLLGDTVPPRLRISYVLRTSDMASMHQDTTDDCEVVGEKLKDILGIPNSTPGVRKIVVKICTIVAERAARLAGAATVGILKKLDKAGKAESGLVAVDGELYEHYQLFRDYLHNSINEMLGREFGDNVVIKHLDDRSGIGAALLAASLSQYEQTT